MSDPAGPAEVEEGPAAPDPTAGERLAPDAAAPHGVAPDGAGVAVGGSAAFEHPASESSAVEAPASEIPAFAAPAGEPPAGAPPPGETPPGEAPEGENPDKRSRSAGATALELLVIVGVAVLLAFLIQGFIVKPYRIPSGSMEPTLQVGQRVLVDRLGSHFSTPHIGEVVVFHPPKGAEEQICGAREAPGSVCDRPDPEEAKVNFIKRIVAGPGDTIQVKNGHVILDGKREHDPYIRACGDSSECNFPNPVKIPPGHWFMMGDNRGESDDSRFWGPVPTGWIVGDAFATYWPPSRIGSL